MHTDMAALRMKGVVRPQHAPTSRKPRIQRKIDGCGSAPAGVSGPIVAVLRALDEVTEIIFGAVSAEMG